MKAHPRAAVLHVRLKRGALCRVFGTRVQKHHDLIFGQESRIQIVPVGCGVEAEVVLRRHLRKPSLGFVQEADMRLIPLAREKTDHPESRFGLDGTERAAEINEGRDAKPFEGCCAKAPRHSHSLLEGIMTPQNMSFGRP